MGVIVGLLLGGCEVIEDLLPDPPCEDVVEVDAVTGRAELVLDPSECVREDLVADRVEYSSLADDDWEPLVGAGANPCNTGSTLLLVIDDLQPDQLAVDPTVEPTYADFVEGVWMKVRFWDGNASAATWSSHFLFGHDDEVVEQSVCVDEEQ